MPLYDLFISYRRLDAQRVQPLVHRLRGLGIEVWIDENEIGDFAAITATITEGLAQSKAVLAWYSAIYPLSRPCQWELTAAYLAAQQAGDPRQRVLIVNPEPSPDHIALPELKDQQYLDAPSVEDQAGYDQLATRIATQVQGLAGILGDIRPLMTPSWFPNAPAGSARFVGRLRHMWQIHDVLWRGQTVIGQLKQGTALAQLVGGGGMGKSLLAAEYALRYGAAYPGGVFWLNARTDAESGAAASIDALTEQREQQWRNLDAWLGMAIKDKTLVEIEGELHAYFAHQNQPFLWVIDDVPKDIPMDDELKRWYAPHPLGKTLLTTRSHEYAASGGMVEVGVLAETEARNLLTQQRPPANDNETAAVDGILTALGRHALAVDVAAACLKEGSYPEFLADLQEPNEDALELAGELASQLPNGHEASIAATLLKSINAVREETRDFLRLAAVLAIAPIPRRLVETVFSSADSLGDTAVRTHAKRVLKEAKEQSLAEGTDDADFSVTVHVLVMRTMRFHDANAERSAQLRAAATQAITHELAEQTDDIRNHAALANWIDHARHLATGAYDDLAVAALCGWLARYDYVRGAYDGARALMEKELELRRRVLGDEHPDTLTSMGSLALTLGRQGDFAGARALQGKVLAHHRRLLGEEHPDTLTSMGNLTRTLRSQGDFAGARALAEKVLDLQRRVLGEKHPYTLNSMGDLASTLRHQGDLAGACALQEKVLELRRRVLGEEHPDTLISMNDLALTLGYQGEFAGARALQEKVLEYHRQVLGEEHPYTLTSMGNLALTLGGQGDLAGARALEEKVLELRRRAQGEEHPDTMTSMSNLAGTLGNQGDLAGARALEEKVLVLRRRLLGEEHPDTLTSMNNLAGTLGNQGDLAGARALEEKVLELRRRLLGEEHPDTLTSMNNLASTLGRQGNFAGARALEEKVLELRRRLLGEEHPDTLNSMHDLAYTLWNMDEHLPAFQLMQTAAEGRARVLGPDHPNTLGSARFLVQMLSALAEATDQAEKEI